MRDEVSKAVKLLPDICRIFPSLRVFGHYNIRDRHTPLLHQQQIGIVTIRDIGFKGVLG